MYYGGLLITRKVNGKCSNVHCFPGNNAHAQNRVDRVILRPGNEVISSLESGLDMGEGVGETIHGRSA